MGPFYPGSINNWYGVFLYFVENSDPWFLRGGHWSDKSDTNQFYFNRGTGDVGSGGGFRITLAP